MGKKDKKTTKDSVGSSKDDPNPITQTKQSEIINDKTKTELKTGVQKDGLGGQDESATNTKTHDGSKDETKEEGTVPAPNYPVDVGGFNRIGYDAPILSMSLMPLIQFTFDLFGPDPVLVISAGGGRAKTGIKNSVKFVTLDRDDDYCITMKTIYTLDVGDNYVTSVTLSYTGEFMLLCCYNRCLLYTIGGTKGSILIERECEFQVEDRTDDPFFKIILTGENIFVSGGNDKQIRFWQRENGKVNQLDYETEKFDTGIVDLSRHPSYENIFALLAETCRILLCLISDKKVYCIHVLEPFESNLTAKALIFNNHNDIIAIYPGDKNSNGYLYKFSITFPDSNSDEKGDHMPSIDHIQVKNIKCGRLVTLIGGFFEDYFGIGTSNGTVGLFSVDNLKENSIKEEIHELPCTSGALYPTYFLYNNKDEKTYDDLKYINLVTGSLDCSIQMMGLAPDMSSSYKYIFYLFGAFIIIIIVVLLISYFFLQ